MRRMAARAPTRTPWMIAGAATVLAAVIGGYLYWKARADHAAAMAQARMRWPIVRQAMVTRLAQPFPIELGAVWAMHGGRICGLVDGKGSFGGLTGMTPFFTEGGTVVFSFDQDPAFFGRTWLDCSGDKWVPLVAGTTTEGFCGTRRGAVRCRAVGVGS
jgi:hypothetical protein